MLQSGFVIREQYSLYFLFWRVKSDPSIKISPLDKFFPSSKLCNKCGHLLLKLPLSVRVSTCPECESEHDRDGNAATVILLAGRYQRATGSGARKVNAYEIRAVVGRSA